MASLNYPFPSSGKNRLEGRRTPGLTLRIISNSKSGFHFTVQRSQPELLKIKQKMWFVNQSKRSESQHPGATESDLAFAQSQLKQTAFIYISSDYSAG